MSAPTTLIPTQADAWHTIADLEALSASGKRSELVEGRLQEMSPSSSEHGRVTKRLDHALTSFIYANELGECFTAEAGFTLQRSPDTVLAPDWAFIRNERLLVPFPASGYWELAPDIVLETRSPSDTARWVEEKTRLWLEAGVTVVLNLNPTQRCLTVERLGRAAQTFHWDDEVMLEELPGLRVPLHTTLRW